eukprot:symbB.v1.2.036714.t2/scaffold5176.1/size30145/3
MRPVPLKFQSVSGESSKQLRLCTWNVLAPSYALHKSFPDVKPETLAADWNVGAGKASRQLTWDEEYLKTSHRQPLLNQVISHLKADALLQLLLEAAASHFGSDKPLALCGDLNMLPWGSGYKLLQTGSLEVPKKFRNVERFLVDRDISKAAKPLRLLGLDTLVESGEEREQRPEASQGLRTAKVPVVARAAREARVLISASKRLVSRADAALAYFIDARQFDMSLARLCIDLAVDLSPERFYTRCEQDRARAFGAPGNGIPLFTCAPAPRDDSQKTTKMENEEVDCDTVTCQGTLCGQIYWFSRDLGSASARARLQVDNLVSLVEKAKQSESLSYLTELHEDLMTESARFLRDGGGCLKQSWKLRSSYEDVEPGELQGPRNISNSKYGFHGCIDYIWLSPEFHPCQRLQLPTVVDLNQEPGKPLRQLAQLLCDNVLLSSNWLFQKLCQLPT